MANRFKMARVAASPHTADVIKLAALWDISDEPPISNSMRIYIVPVEPESSIPLS
jgi:hypothetical protein